MDMGFFWRGMVIGFSIAAPVGPIGVLCIRRTLADGRLHGLVSGLGAASADAMYGMVAGFGLTAVSAFLVDQSVVLRVVGGAFLLWLGMRTAWAQPGDQAAPVRSRGLATAYTSTFALTLTNPATILSFAAIFAGLGLAEFGHEASAALALVAGVFTGSAAWWLVLSSGVGLLRARIAARHMRWLNGFSGAALFGFGVLALVSAAL